VGGDPAAKKRAGSIRRGARNSAAARWQDRSDVEARPSLPMRSEPTLFRNARNFAHAAIKESDRVEEGSLF